jgi:hypothetical protein
MSFIATTPDSIAFVQLVALRGAVRLESVGLRHSSRRSMTKLAKQRYGLKGNTASVLAQLSAMIEQAIADKQANNG